MSAKKILNISLITALSISASACTWWDGEEETSQKSDDVKIVYKSKYDSPKLPILEQGLEESLKGVQVPSVSAALKEPQETQARKTVITTMPAVPGEVVEVSDDLANVVEREMREIRTIDAQPSDVGIRAVEMTSKNPEVSIKRISLDDYKVEQQQIQEIKAEKVQTYNVIDLDKNKRYTVSSPREVRAEVIQAQPIETKAYQTASLSADYRHQDIGSDQRPSAEDARVGQCYGKVRIEGTYKEVAEKVKIEEAYTETEIIPAKYDLVDELITVREESVKYVEIPATYRTVTETITLEPEKREVVTIPAKYQTVQERVMVRPAQKVWKEGSGLIEKVGDDGSIMCLVEEPAVYETVEKRVVIEPARSETRLIPAVTKTITREIIDRPAQVVKQAIPAVKKAIKKRVQVAPAKELKINIPPRYKTVTKKVAVNPDQVKWLPVLCEVNITSGMVAKVQEALMLRGYETGGIDGIFGSRTEQAINKFQNSLGLESGGITIRTLRALGIPA